MNLHSIRAARIRTVIMILSGLFPLSLALALFQMPAVIPHLPVLCGITGLAAVLADSPSRHCRLLVGGIGILCLCIYGILIFRQPLPLLLIPFLYLLQLLILLRPHPEKSFFQLPFFLFCLALYGIFQFGMLALRRGNIPWHAALPVFPLAFLLFLFTSLVLNNLDLLQVEIRFGRRVPSSVLNVSRLNIFLLLLASLVIACIPQISQFLHSMYRTLRDLLISLVLFLSSLFAGNETVHDGAIQAGSFFPAAESAAEAAPNPIVELILNLITWTVIAALTAYLLFRIAKLLVRFLRFLVRRFQQYISAFDTTYVDTYEDLPLSDSVRKGFLRRRKRIPQSFSTSPRDRIRFFYLKMLLRHPEWSVSETAKDHLDQPAAELYEKARYSTHDISDEDAVRFSSLAGRPRKNSTIRE